MSGFDIAWEYITPAKIIMWKIWVNFWRSVITQNITRAQKNSLSKEKEPHRQESSHPATFFLGGAKYIFGGTAAYFTMHIEK